MTLARWVTVGSLVLTGVLVMVGWYQALDRDLADPPWRAASRPLTEVPPSRLALDVSLPLERIQAAAEAAAPSSYASSGRGPDICAKRRRRRVCVGTHYDFNLTRGPITLAEGPGNTLRISVPLQVAGHGGFRGRGARRLHLAARPFEASSDAVADVALSFKPNGCPQAQVAVDFSNLDAKVEIVSGVWVSVSNLIESAVRERIRTMGEQTASVLRCDDFRRLAQQVWFARSFPLSLPADPRPLHVNVLPVSFGFSGVQVTPSAVKLLLSLGVRASVSDTRITAAGEPPSAPQTVPLRRAALRLSLPLRIAYDGMAARLQSAFAKPLKVTTPAGAATITLDEITVYPAGERIAVGAHIRAELPGHFLATRGWLYWTARPVVSRDGRAVQLADMGGSRIRDSELAGTLAALLDGELRSRLAAAGEIDLTGRIANARSSLTSTLTRHIGATSIEMSRARMGLGRIVPGAAALFVEGVFNSGAELVLDEAR